MLSSVILKVSICRENRKALFLNMSRSVCRCPVKVQSHYPGRPYESDMAYMAGR